MIAKPNVALSVHDTLAKPFNKVIPKHSTSSASYLIKQRINQNKGLFK